MKCLIQRVKEAQVLIDNKVHAQIDQGLLVFVCAEPQDTEATVKKAVDKLLNLRIFSDTEAKMNLSLQQINGGLLVVSIYLGSRYSSRQSTKFYQCRRARIS